MCTRRVALIQGPPGTGKTYVGVKFIELLVKNLNKRGPDLFDQLGGRGRGRGRRTLARGEPPILCVCYTNYALDQLLESLLDAGVRGIVRLGGGSKSERVQALNIHNVHTVGMPSHLIAKKKAAQAEAMAVAEKLEHCRAILSCTDRLPLNHIDATFDAVDPALYYSLLEPPTDEEGFIRANLVNKTPAQLWEQWLRPPRSARGWSATGPDGVAHDSQWLEAAAAAAGGGGGMFDALGTDEDGHEDQVHGYYSSEDDSNPITRDLGVVREVSLDPPRSVQEILSQARDAWALPYDERMVLYDYLERQASAGAKDEMQHLAQTYQFNHEQYKEAKDRLELETLMSATVIGMTTTKASKLQHVLQQLGVKVVVIEEAAEVLEAHVLSCLSEDTEHLILIGDHLQLRPKVETYKLTAASRQGYNLDVSLFERLALGRDLPIVQLTQQRRMRPEFADLIRLSPLSSGLYMSSYVYPSLQDHPSCHHHPDVPGMRSNLWFFHHEVMEDAVKEGFLEDGVSKSNRHEVALVVGLTSYLLKQGYGPGQITVLTPYLKQLFDLRAALSAITMTFTDERDELALDVLGAAEDDVGTVEAGGQGQQQQQQQAMTQTTAKDRDKMATIDNFQGEESEIIINSLVRSNPDGSIGFLRMENRVNVLLSRAKDGMYLLGNADTFTAKPEHNIWPAMIELLKERGQLGRSFPLICGRHPEYQVDVSSASDFELLAQNGGCTRPSR